MKVQIIRTIAFGMAAGIAATLVMDIFVAVAMVAMGNAASFMFTFIGQVAATFFKWSTLSVRAIGDIGMLIHYGFGLGFGGLFAILAALVSRLKLDTLGRSMLGGILFIEIVSQPFLASAPLILHMLTPDTIRWYVLSTCMHALYGLVLGALWHYRAAIIQGAPAVAQT